LPFNWQTHFVQADSAFDLRYRVLLARLADMLQFWLGQIRNVRTVKMHKNVPAMVGGELKRRWQSPNASGPSVESAMREMIEFLESNLYPASTRS
jgi:hypothetical protein